jgi:glycosyltransferase involved in cell wall biosynthesis
MSSKVLVAQLGARKHYQEPILFHQWGMLDKFYTDFYMNDSLLTRLLKQNFLYQNLPKIVKKGLDRYTSLLSTAEIKHFPKLAYNYQHYLKQAKPWEKSKIHIHISKNFCNKIIKSGLGEANVVYGFDGACLELFEYAKSKGIKCILDQTVAERSLIHELLLQEEQLWHGWSKFPFQVYEGDLELVKRQQKEQSLADFIICGSSFVKESLVKKGIDQKKIIVVSLGSLQDGQFIKSEHQAITPQIRGDGLRILFAGSVGLRKGIQYLLQALRLIKGEIPFSCKIAGSLEIKPQIINDFSDVCEFVGLVPRSEMKQLYSWADVFVLPSLCEGSAMVTYEALSCNLPVITTYNTGSIVRDNIDGFIVATRDIKEIAKKLKYLYINNLNQAVNIELTNYWRKITIDAHNKLKNCLLNN